MTLNSTRELVAWCFLWFTVGGLVWSVFYALSCWIRKLMVQADADMADALDDEPEARCVHCGKSLEEFGDLGCEYCDRRHPGFGTTQ